MFEVIGAAEEFPDARFQSGDTAELVFDQGNDLRVGGLVDVVDPGALRGVQPHQKPTERQKRLDCASTYVSGASAGSTVG